MKYTKALQRTLAAMYSLAFLCCLLSAGCSNAPKPAETNQSAAPAPLNPEDVELSSVQLKSPDGGKTFVVAGQITNRSSRTPLTEMQLKVIMQDCLSTGICEILAEDTAKVAAEVPAGQTRDFQVQPNFKDMPAPKGTLGFRYSVVSANGGPASPA